MLKLRVFDMAAARVKVLQRAIKWMFQIYCEFLTLHNAYKFFVSFERKQCIQLFLRKSSWFLDHMERQWAHWQAQDKLFRQASLEYYLNFQIEVVVTCNRMKFWGSKLSQRVSLHNGSYKGDVSLLGKFNSIARYVQNSLHESLFIANGT